VVGGSDDQGIVSSVFGDAYINLAYDGFDVEFKEGEGLFGNQKEVTFTDIEVYVLV